jgi:hypothetical protein
MNARSALYPGMATFAWPLCAGAHTVLTDRDNLIPGRAPSCSLA